MTGSDEGWPPAFDAYGVEEFTIPQYGDVRKAILDAGGVESGVQDPQDYLIRVREVAADDTARSVIAELAVEAILRRTVDESYARDLLVAVRQRSVDRRIREVQNALQTLSAVGDGEHVTAVQKELWTLHQYRMALRERGAEAL